MARPRVQTYCRECGEPCPRRGHWDHGYKCINCSVRAFETATNQIREGEGEYYEKWLRGLARSMMERLAKLDSAGQPPDSTSSG